MTNEDLTYDQYTPYCGRGRLGGLLLFLLPLYSPGGLAAQLLLLHLSLQTGLVLKHVEKLRVVNLQKHPSDLSS